MNDSASAGLPGFSIIPNWMLTDERVTPPMILAYLGLATYADREGVCWPSIPKLAARCKLSPRGLQEALSGLVAVGVLQVTRRREGTRNLPNLYRLGVHSGVVQEMHQVVQEVHQGGAGDAPEQDSLNHLPPSPPSGGTPQGEPLEGLEEPPAPEPDHFGLFWQAYPRKTNRPAALKAWTKALKGGTHWSLIVGAAAAYAEDPNREAAFTKHPATWLNGEGWNDDPLPERIPAGTYAEPAATIPASGPMSQRVEDCASIGRVHRMLPDGTCMLCEVRRTG